MGASESCISSFFFQAEDGIRDLVRSRGLGDVYKRQMLKRLRVFESLLVERHRARRRGQGFLDILTICKYCLLYTSDAADDLLCVDLGGRRIIKKKTKTS